METYYLDCQAFLSGRALLLRPSTLERINVETKGMPREPAVGGKQETLFN